MKEPDWKYSLVIYSVVNIQSKEEKVARRKKHDQRSTLRAWLWFTNCMLISCVWNPEQFSTGIIASQTGWDIHSSPAGRDIYLKEAGEQRPKSSWKTKFFKLWPNDVNGANYISNENVKFWEWSFLNAYKPSLRQKVYNQLR